MAIDSGAIVLNRFLSGELTLLPEVASAKTAADFASWLAPIVRKNWMVDCQGPPVHCLDSTAALKYLARYVAGAAFHDERILSADEQGCVLHVKDYRHDTVGTLRLTPDEFVQRFTLHLLPRQLRRMRYAGMFHAGAAKKKLPLCRKLLLEHHARAALTHASTLTASASDDGADSHRDTNATGAPDSTGDANATEPTSEELRQARKRHNELQRHARAAEERREKLAELHERQREARITAAVQGALRPGQPLEGAINRLDAELAGKPIDPQSPDEPYERSCPRCLSPSMQPLGNYTALETEQLKASWALSSRRIKSATTRLVVMAVTLVITVCDTLWLAAEPAPRPSRLTNHHAATDVQRGAHGERRRTPASGELHAARSQAFLASACSVATTLDIEQLFLSPIPDT